MKKSRLLGACGAFLTYKLSTVAVQSTVLFICAFIVQTVLAEPSTSAANLIDFEEAGYVIDDPLPTTAINGVTWSYPSNATNDGVYIESVEAESKTSVNQKSLEYHKSVPGEEIALTLNSDLMTGYNGGAGIGRGSLEFIVRFVASANEHTPFFALSHPSEIDEDNQLFSMFLNSSGEFIIYNGELQVTVIDQMVPDTDYRFRFNFDVNEALFDFRITNRDGQIEYAAGKGFQMQGDNLGGLLGFVISPGEQSTPRFQLDDVRIWAVQKANPQTYADRAGIYGMVATNKTILSKINGYLAHPDFDGLSIRTDWSLIEPVEGQRDWSYIDNLLSMAHRQGKKVNLRIFAGWRTPEWVFDAGAEKFKYYERHNRNRLSRMPVPWDEVFQAKWFNFVREMGARYDNHPNMNMIHLIGANRSSAEMFLPRTLPDQVQWLIQGYTADKLTESWKRIIDRFAVAFPDTPWILALSTPLFVDDGVIEAVSSYGVDRYPWQFIEKISSWKETRSVTHAPVAELLLKVSTRTHGGLEAAGVFPGRGGDINTAISNAISWHAIHFNESYFPNIGDVSGLANEINRRRQMLISASLTASQTDNEGIRLHWVNPNGYDGFQAVRILRGANHGFPMGPNDYQATLIFEGSTRSTFLDTDLVAGDRYRYSMFELPSGYLIGQADAVILLGESDG